MGLFCRFPVFCLFRRTLLPFSLSYGFTVSLLYFHVPSEYLQSLALTLTSLSPQPSPLSFFLLITALSPLPGLPRRAPWFLYFCRPHSPPIILLAHVPINIDHYFQETLFHLRYTRFIVFPSKVHPAPSLVKFFCADIMLINLSHINLISLSQFSLSFDFYPSIWHPPRAH